MECVHKFYTVLAMGILCSTQLYAAKKTEKVKTPQKIATPEKVVERIIYPEEITREQWDKGCGDWLGNAPYISGIAVNTDRKEGVFRIYAAARLEPETGQSLDKVYDVASRILGNGLEYTDWVMPGINSDPEGSPYFVQIDSATSTNFRASYEYIIRAMYSLNVLWIRREGASSIVFKQEDAPVPNCPESFDLSIPQIAKKVVYRMMPKEGILDYMIGEAYVSRTSDQVDLKLRAVVKPANVLYQVIPERMIKTQVDYRARKIFQNFLKKHAEMLLKESTKG